MGIIDFVKPELMALVVMLWVVGKMIKGIDAIKDKYIPLILGGVGVIIATAYVVGISALSDDQALLSALLSGVVQGILCAGLAVYGNEIVAQLKKKE